MFKLTLPLRKQPHSLVKFKQYFDTNSEYGIMQLKPRLPSAKSNLKNLVVLPNSKKQFF